MSKIIHTPNKPTKFNERWFKDRLKRLNLSYRETAKRLGMHHSSITHTFKGRRKMTVVEAVQWANLFNVPVTEVLLHAGIEVGGDNPPESLLKGDVPVVGWVDADYNVVFGVARGPRFVENPSGGYLEGVTALRCQGAKGLDGALLYYKTVSAGEFNYDCLERLCVVVAGGKRLVRIVRRGYSDGRNNLFLFGFDGQSGLAEEEAIVESATPVLWLRL